MKKTDVEISYRRLAVYAAMHWKVYRCICCGRCVLDASWHPECEEETL